MAEESDVQDCPWEEGAHKLRLFFHSNNISVVFSGFGTVINFPEVTKCNVFGGNGWGNWYLMYDPYQPTTPLAIVSSASCPWEMLR